MRRLLAPVFLSLILGAIAASLGPSLDFSATPAQAIIPCPTTPDGTVSWWTGDSTPNDYWGGNNGTFTPNLYTAAKVGNGFSFTDAQMDPVVVADDPSLHPTAATGFTIDLWFKEDDISEGAVPTYVNLVSKTDAPSWASYYLALTYDGKVEFSVQNKSTTSWATWQTGVLVTDTNPHHIAVAWRADNFDDSDAHFYFDGASTPGAITYSGGYESGFDIGYGTDPLFIGGTPTGNYNDGVGLYSIRGWVDEVEFIDGLVSASKIQSIFDADAGGKCKNTNSATFTVNKSYVGGGASPEVSVQLDCGEVGTIIGPNPRLTSGLSAAFEVKTIQVSSSCTASEVSPAGYTQDLDASTCDEATSLGASQQDASCTITNDLNSATVTVTKTYSPAAGPQPEVSVTLDCHGNGTVEAPNPTTTSSHVASFTVKGIDGSANCTASEAAIADYSQDLAASDCDDGISVDANQQDAACDIVNVPAPSTGTLEVRKLVLGFFDSGRFDLLIDDATHANAVRSGGSTGPVEVSAGQHTVAEAGAAGTSLSSYRTTGICYGKHGGFLAYGFRPSLSVNVSPGQDVVCTFINQRLWSWFWWR